MSEEQVPEEHRTDEPEIVTVETEILRDAITRDGRAYTCDSCGDLTNTPVTYVLYDSAGTARMLLAVKELDQEYLSQALRLLSAITLCPECVDTRPIEAVTNVDAVDIVDRREDVPVEDLQNQWAKSMTGVIATLALGVTLVFVSVLTSLVSAGLIFLALLVGMFFEFFYLRQRSYKRWKSARTEE